jgi:hypothetical protein
MQNFFFTPRFRGNRTLQGALLGCSLLGATALGAPMQLATNLTFQAGATLRETFDSNVYLQDVEPSPLIPNAMRPFQESFVTTIIPRLGLDYRPAPAFGAAVSYSPEVNFFHAESSEDHVTHRGLINMSGRIGEIGWEVPNSFTWIDGSEVGPTWGGPGGAPAIGGVPIRDRRAAFIYRGGVRLVHARDRWLVRPAMSGYLHDFFTEQRVAPGYVNYIDRSDLNGGIDVGYKVYENTHFVTGYRYGFQTQDRVINSPLRYDNEYHRVLFGLEGQPAKWIRLGISLGPDFRHFGERTAPDFDNRHTLLNVDSAVVITPGARDTITLTARRHAQPAYASPTAYEDITYDFAWRHKLSERFAATAGFRAYIGDWLSPVNREDWIYTPSGMLTYTHDQHISADLAYSYDWVDSKVPDTAGREYTRHLVSVALRYTF